LQEQAFELLGSTRTRRVDVRLVAATNRDLVQMVEAGTFREDLYYRLNVFPLTVPPLRARIEDIPLLVRHFVHTYTQRVRKRIDTIPADTSEALTRYHWPGNIRELQNVIERAAILIPDTILRLPLAEWQRSRSTPDISTNSRTLEEVECEHILQVLQETNWVVGGQQGAAARLGLRRTTLLSRHYFIAWRSSAFDAGHHDRLLTPVDYCRHRAPAPRCPGCPATPAFFT
jgi:formate hydrogenlyase transcriptional activator